MLWRLKLALLFGARFGSADQPLSGLDALVSCLACAKVPQALPGSPEFAISSSPHNIRLRFTPLAIALPTTVAHVQAAVACGRRLGVSVNARSGGHNYASHGIGGEDGHLVLDLKYINTTSVDLSTGLATVGSGARLGNMAVALNDQGKRALPHGICPKVGVGGHVLHGGWGYSSHNHGLFLDYLEEAEVVLANSSVVTASRTQNTDLFWAMRGAGMSFGIATSFTFRTIAQPDEVQLFYYPFIWNLTQAKAGWRVFQDYSSSTARPSEMNIRVVIASAALLAAGTNGTIFIFEGAYHGTQIDYAAAIKPFRDAVMAVGGFADFLNYPEVTNVSYMDALLYANNNVLLGYTFNVEPLESGPDDQIQTNGFFKSMMTDALSDTASDAVIELIANGGVTNPNRSWLIITAAIGGPNSAVARVSPESTSYAHRSSLFVWEIGDLVAANDTYPADIGIPWVNTFVEAVDSNEKKNVGMYYNYADPSLGDHEAAGRRYWLGNYDRLASLKSLFDADKVFENPQTIG